MRKTELAVVGFALFLFFLVGPLTAKRDQQIQKEEVREEQVADAEEIFDQAPGERFRITFQARSMKENNVADIIWLKKAAEVAMDAGIPHFNVREKKMSREFNPKLQRRMNVVEGVIELDNDPMGAEYDANEIQALVMPELTQ